MVGEALVPFDQRDGGCPISGNIEGKVGQDSEQPDLVEDAAGYWRGIGLYHF